MAERIPRIEPRAWKRPTYVGMFILGLLLLPGMIGSVRRMIDDGAVKNLGDILWVVLPPIVLLFEPARSWTNDIRASRHIGGSRRVGMPGLTRHVRLGIRGAHDLGEFCGRSVFTDGETRGMVAVSAEGLAIWNCRTREIECNISWDSIGSVQPARVDTAIWKSSGIRLTPISDEDAEAGTGIGLELRSKALFGAFSAGPEASARFAMELETLRKEVNSSDE